MHVYMYNQRMEYSDKAIKEQAADVLAIYLGFYEQMIKGYHQPYGWLSKKELNYVNCKIKEYKCA